MPVAVNILICLFYDISFRFNISLCSSSSSTTLSFFPPLSLTFTVLVLELCVCLYCILISLLSFSPFLSDFLSFLSLSHFLLLSLSPPPFLSLSLSTSLSLSLPLPLSPSLSFSLPPSLRWSVLQAHMDQLEEMERLCVREETLLSGHPVMVSLVPVEPQPFTLDRCVDP